jgi:hypothetical protein
MAELKASRQILQDKPSCTIRVTWNQFIFGAAAADNMFEMLICFVK